MSAWQQLLNVSSLTVGTAWDLLNNISTGGTGVVLNNGGTAVIPSSELSVAVNMPTTTPVVANITTPIPVVVPDTSNIVIAVSPSEMHISVSPPTFIF